MITLKSKDEIETIKKGGLILKSGLEYVTKNATEGKTTQELDTLAEKYIIENGGKPGFKRVKGYRWSTCISINDQIVHTPPSTRVLKKSDVVTIDMGVYYNGFHTDSATTFVVDGVSDSENDRFLSVGSQTLTMAIDSARVGNRIGHISKTIFEQVTKNGYFIINELTGHGVGRELHEDPLIPGFLDLPIDKTPAIKNGMVLAIEVIYSLKKEKIFYESDNWSLKTKGGSLAACFEKTIAISENKTLILT